MGIMVETREGVKQPSRQTCVRVKKVKKCAKLEDAFGADIDYAMLVKHYGDAGTLFSLSEKKILAFSPMGVKPILS